MASTTSMHKIWIDQGEAAPSIRENYGLQAAFDYLISEKLMNFSEAAIQHSVLAQELPRFVAEVSRIFSLEELHSEIDRFEQEQGARALEAASIIEGDEFLEPNPEALATRSQRFAIIKSLLIAPQLGTS
jgi:hypothetical protein